MWHIYARKAKYKNSHKTVEIRQELTYSVLIIFQVITLLIHLLVNCFCFCLFGGHIE